MKPVRIYLVDDEAYARLRLRDLLQDMQSEFANECVADSGSPTQALREIGELKPDIVLLDMQMPEMSGLQLAEQIHKTLQPAPQLIFITAHDQYALAAFEQEALDYLLKPVHPERLLKALKRASSMHSSLSGVSEVVNKRKPILIHDRNQQIALDANEVVYCQAEAKYVTIQTYDRQYIADQSLQQLEMEYADYFLRIHRNCLVAKMAVRGVIKKNNPESAQETWFIQLGGSKEELPISRRQWTRVKAWLQQHKLDVRS